MLICKVPMAKRGKKMDDKIILIEMGKRIATRRKELKLTQDTLAEKVGVSLQTISCVELGKKAIRPCNLIRLCSVLQTSTDYILTGTKNTQEMSTINKQISQLSNEEYQLVENLVRHFSQNK